MKWAIIGILAVVILGGAGYAVYTLTNAPEKAQEWWDEKKLDNFETLANRELDDFEKKIADHKETLKKLKVERITWAGHENLGDSNTKEQKTGFWTLVGYQSRMEFRNNQGKALAEAYKKAAGATGAAIDSSTGELDPAAVITVAAPALDGTTNTHQLKAAEVVKLLGENEADLTELEANAKRVEGVVKEYDAAVAEWTKQIDTEENELKELRKQVKTVAAEIKLQKAKQDLAEMNKAIRGEGGNSELGKMIKQFEDRKTKFKAEELVAADEGKKASKEVSLSDLDKPTKGEVTKKSRFLK